MAASDSFTLGRSRSSRSLRLSSVSLRSLRSAMLCFLFLIWTGSPPGRMAKAGGIFAAKEHQRPKSPSRRVVSGPTTETWTGVGSARSRRRFAQPAFRRDEELVFLSRLEDGAQESRESRRTPSLPTRHYLFFFRSSSGCSTTRLEKSYAGSLSRP